MSDLIALIKAQAAFFEVYRETKRLADELRPFENSSATHIQRLFRGTRIRIDIKIKSDAATEIKRVVRGHVGRRQARLRLQERTDSRQRSLFDYFTIQLQRCFRGFYSRKYRKDHAARRAYFQKIEEKNKEVLDMMSEYALVQVSRDQQSSQEEKERQFNVYAENLHHLVSTKNTPGIYRPATQHLEAPTMNNMPVEDHIRGVVKDLLKARGIAKTGLIKDILGTRKVPYVGLKNRLSLQASAPYEICKDEKKREKMLHKILQSGEKDFLAGGLLAKNLMSKSTPQLKATAEPYRDPGSNPFLVRGVPENQQELENSKILGKPLFVRHLNVPYHTSLGGNKSTVLPNDLFEVIAEAQETGGVLHRNLGYSTRFGVSDSADNRVPGGTIAMVQPRLSAVQHSKRVAMKRNTHIIKTRLLQKENVESNNDDSSDSDDDTEKE